MPHHRLERDVRFLKAYAVGATLLAATLLATGFRPGGGPTRFEEIDVERINIVEADGQLRMVISNKARQHPGISNGKVIERSYPRPPGILFFNHLGDEMGGLVFDENGGNGHFGSLTFDKVRNDQTIGFRYLEGDNGTYSTGLTVWQQPNVPSEEMLAHYAALDSLPDAEARRAALAALRERGAVTTQRLYLGKYRDDTAVLQLADLAGRPRIVLKVAGDGMASLDFLDADGTVVQSLPARE